MSLQTKEELVQQVHTKIDQFHEAMIHWRRTLHQHPELSFQEEQTANFIADRLQQHGICVERNIAGHTVIGKIIGNEQGPTIAFRADIDALPLDDEKILAYKSKVPEVMHACGHDGHTAALLGLAAALSTFKRELKGTIMFIFQHAEELPPGGAIELVQAGVLDNVDAVFAAHIAPDLPLGQVAFGEGYRMAAVDKFELTIQGRGGHGARPHLAVDSIVIGSDIVNGLQKIVSRGINPLDSVVVTVGKFHAGSAFNIIADRATLEGTVRTFKAELREQVEQQIYAITEGITQSFGASFTIDYLNGYPALYNHEAETEKVRQLVQQQLPTLEIVDYIPSLGAEDFSYFLLEKPGTFIKVGSNNGSEETQFPLHHPKFDFDEEVLINISKIFASIAIDYVG